MKTGPTETAVDFLRPERVLPLRLVGGKGHYGAVIEAVLSAKRSVWIATANLKELMVEDHRAAPGRRRTARAGSASSRTFRSILAAFDELAGKGVELRLLHASPPSRPFRAELARHPRLSGKGGRSAMLAMRLCPRVHLKLVIIDGEQVYLGSANFTGAGLGAKGEGRRNFELGLLSRDDLLLDETQALFDHLWSGGPCASCKLRPDCPAPLDGSAAGPRLAGL